MPVGCIAGCVMTIEAVGFGADCGCVGAVANCVDEGGKVPTAVAVTGGPEGADKRPSATAADDGGGDRSSKRVSLPGMLPISRAGKDGGAGMLLVANAGATPVGGAAGGLFAYADEKAGANTADGGAEELTDIDKFGWYCGGGGICDGCTAWARGGAA